MYGCTSVNRHGVKYEAPGGRAIPELAVAVVSEGPDRAVALAHERTNNAELAAGYQHALVLRL